jgi:hypothetical protein
MVQVFRALKLSSHATFFTAVYILDSYLVAKCRSGVSLGQDCLYLLGMTVVLMSSKFEDVEPVLMKTLLEKAGYNRFTRDQVVDMEKDILQTLGFHIHNPACYFNKASTTFKQVVSLSGGSTQSSAIKSLI